MAGSVVMVDGSFDPLHDGHIAYFNAATELGFPVFCNITSDRITELKHRVLLPQQSRAIVIDAIRSVRYVYCAQQSTKDVLAQLQPVMYVKGADWLARGGVPDDEAATCARFGIGVLYLDTVVNSSTRLLEEFRRQ